MDSPGNLNGDKLSALIAAILPFSSGVRSSSRVAMPLRKGVAPKLPASGNSGGLAWTMSRGYPAAFKAVSASGSSTDARHRYHAEPPLSVTPSELVSSWNQTAMNPRRAGE